MYLAVELKRQYTDQITGIGCEQLVINRTRITSTRQSILDCTHVDNLLQPHIRKSAVVNYKISDYLPTYIGLHLKLKLLSKNIHRPYSTNITPHEVEKFLVSFEQILDTPKLKYNTKTDILVNTMKILTNVHFLKMKQSKKR